MQTTRNVKTIRLEYFAIFKDQAGVASETIQTNAVTARELYAQIARRHRFSLEEDRLRVAINEDFRPFDSKLQDGDEVVFIPPVAGG